MKKIRRIIIFLTIRLKLALYHSSSIWKNHRVLMEAANACGIISKSQRRGRFQYETTNFCVGLLIEKQKHKRSYLTNSENIMFCHLRIKSGEIEQNWQSKPVFSVLLASPKFTNSLPTPNRRPSDGNFLLALEAIEPRVWLPRPRANRFFRSWWLAYSTQWKIWDN